jgi:acetylornithine/succinyldiaminopimelate/putrescine aminotransferase/predicted amino acid dehydrogenase/acyl-coenzyme A synthetase/AMP-(fatty) acid ligase
MDNSFDLVFENPLDKGRHPLKTIGNILFSKLPGRKEESKIILSHFENQYVEISLGRLRSIILRLLRSFNEKGISRGQTVILLTFQGCNEMITALIFIALAAKGCRTFLPMYSEAEEFSEWIDMTHSEHVILPQNEVRSLEGHEREKSEIEEIRDIADQKRLKIWDNLTDFGIDAEFSGSLQSFPESETFSDNEFNNVNPSDDVLIVTTSGTSGRSRLVVYTHEAYYLNCLAWGKAGFYDKNVLGGAGFTPLLTHTMGIRALINALWTGEPVCLIITEWFITKPETVRYLLLKMKPEHITGGPAVFNTFLEFFRVFPELKALISNNLKTLVSSGAAYDNMTAGEVYNATGMRLHNAFGTTETQQVFSTLLSTSNVFNESMIPLGNPLPGVSIGLMRSDSETNHFRLYVKSAFSHKYCIGEEEDNANKYFDTGDIVCLDERNCFFYIRRASLDYFKDCFGVKIPILKIREYYNSLISSVLHAQFYPLINFPGLAALIFINDGSISPGQVNDARILKKFSGVFEEINNRLINTIEPFEFQHRHVCRIAIINTAPPKTGKGTISVKQINAEYHDLISRLTDTRKDASGIESTDILSHGSYKYAQYLSPQIGTFLSSLKLNYQYHRGKKDSLFTYLHGKEVEILDVTGGYGTNLLGHNNSEISREVTDFIQKDKIAICNQLSIPHFASLLAEKLNLIIGSETGRSYQVIFGNSGSEAVEIAIHHACFEWENRIKKIRDQQYQTYASDNNVNIVEVWNKNQEIIEKSKSLIIAVANSFHGNSTGARSILGNQKKRKRFSRLTNIEVVFLDDRSEAWREQLKNTIEKSLITLDRAVQSEHETKIIQFKISTIIGAFAEPVIGEGGIRLVNKDFLKELSLHDFPLISDEIQCGLGRTGEIPECKYAHYYLFGKALGGGIEKISAVMIDKSRFCFDFSEYYTSTFGNGELAAVAGLKALDIISSGLFINQIRETGSYLRDKLISIRNKYPDIISDVQGKELMLAIYFNPECAAGNIILRILFEKERAGYLFSAWLLNCHQIRMFPTLSAPNTLRIEPSAYLTRQESDRICIAIDELCSIITGKKMYDLFLFLMDNDTFSEDKKGLDPGVVYKQNLEPPADGSTKVAFIAHFAFPLRELRMLVPDFARASDTGLRILFNRIQALMEMDPVLMIALNLFHGKIHFSFYVIPLDSSELEFLHKSGKRKKIVVKIQEGVNLAAQNGAQVISLGGFNSILTNNGLSLYEPRGSRIITGNTLTAASGIRHLVNTVKLIPEFDKPNVIAVIGSTGNIGQIITEMLSDQKDICSELILVSRSEKRTNEFIDDLRKRMSVLVKITGSGNINDIKNSDILIICSNTSDPIILPHHIAGNKPVLISDLSVPSAVAPEVNRLPNVRSIPFSAYVTLPEDTDAVISSYSTPGTIFCCAAEAILLGLEEFQGSLKGRILPEEVKAITLQALKYDLFQNVGNLGSFKTTRM